MKQPIRTPRTRRDQRPAGLLLMTVGLLLTGLLIVYYPSSQEMGRLWEALFPGQTNSAGHGKDPRVSADTAAIVATGPHLPGMAESADDPLRQRLDREFQRAVVMLHAREHEYALLALRQVLAIQPRMPEAYVNSGYALIGLQRYEEAKEAFLFAIDLRPEQANAYYGLAVALDALQDRMGALGAMYSFLHRAAEDDPYRRKAAAAVWEWEAERNQEQPGKENPDSRPGLSERRE